MDALWGWVQEKVVAKPVDYLSDPRIDLLSFSQVKAFLKANGVKPNDLQYASTKFALIAYAEKFHVKLEPLLDAEDRKAFPEKYVGQPPPPSPKFARDSASQTPTGGSAEVAATPAAPTTMPNAAPADDDIDRAAPVSAPRKSKKAVSPKPKKAKPAPLTMMQKVEQIKAKLGIPAEVDFPAERMAATVPIEGTTEQKIDALHAKVRHTSARAGAAAAAAALLARSLRALPALLR